MSVVNDNYVPISINSRFSEIDKRVTMLYTTGSMEVKAGLYINENELSALESEFENYDFED